MTATLREELYNYCAVMIPYFNERESLALTRIDLERCDLHTADCSLYDEMTDCIKDFCEDNGIDYDREDIDTEQVFSPADWTC